MAERRESQDSVGKGDTLKNLAERPAMDVSVQSHDIEVLLQGLYNILNERNECPEELGFVYDDDLVLTNPFE
jgi:hypothetical protein